MISNEVGSESDGFFSQACDRRQIHLELLFSHNCLLYCQKAFMKHKSCVSIVTCI